MSHDENVYPDPFTFKPERFFNSDGTLNDNNRVLTYGFGRRICVRKAIGSDVTWLFIATFLASFNIGKTKDEFANDVEYDDSFTDFGVVIHKKPLNITPRSEQVRQVIENTANHC